jgi:GNAT acetyltransferase-like protein
MTRTTVRFVPVGESEEWQATLPVDADIYSSAGYVHAAAGPDRGLLVEVRSATARIVLPIIERVVPQRLGMTGALDAMSPYGYPGVYTEGPAGAIDACWSELAQALTDRGIVNLFLRLHPLETPTLPQFVRIVDDRETRYVPLVGGLEGAFAGHECRTQRSQVRRAATLGITHDVEEAPGPAVLQDFKLLYDQTMNRLGALEDYYFPMEYYTRLSDGCGENIGLVSVRDAHGMTVAQAIVMAGPRFAHYHLSARVDSAHNVASHVLLHSAAEWAAARGLDALHLGGGRTRSTADPLYQFKARVGHGVAMFRTAQLISDPNRHRELVERGVAATGRRSEWFQSYRDTRCGADI